MSQKNPHPPSWFMADRTDAPTPLRSASFQREPVPPSARERIDGVDYPIGSTSWRQARRQDVRRHDAEVAEATAGKKTAEMKLEEMTAERDTLEARVEELEAKISEATPDRDEGADTAPSRARSDALRPIPLPLEGRHLRDGSPSRPRWGGELMNRHKRGQR